MIEFQRHIGAICKYLDDIRFIVFAAQTKEHSGMILFEQELLDFLPRRSYRYASRAIFAAYPAPERLIAIQNDYLIGVARKGVNFTREHCRQGAEE